MLQRRESYTATQNSMILGMKILNFMIFKLLFYIFLSFYNLRILILVELRIGHGIAVDHTCLT